MQRTFACASVALLLCACGGGGEGVSAPAAPAAEPVTKTVFVTAARDEAIVAAGRDVQLTLANVAAAPATSSIRQTGGTPLGALTLNGSQLSFHAPDLPAAATADLQLTTTDTTGQSSNSFIRVLVSPASDSGRLLTLVGSSGSAGLHWIITGDGFTEAQQDDLRRTALDMARALQSAPELAQHAGIWNVHVLGAISRTSGVDTAASNADTAFDATLACTGVARVACVDWHKVQNAVLAEQAPRGWLAVVLNTTQYVGTSGPNGLIISRHAAAPALSLHEMGHQVAGLADEYVDAVTAQALLPSYVEGRYANVTTQADPALIPWRHWLGTPGSDIGLHEGAYYSATGFYRAKTDSLMRTLDAPLGEVNGEAWLRAQYLRAPPVSAVSPAATHVRGLGGDALDFEVVSSWPRPVLALRWFLDEVEILDARNAWRHRVVSDGSVHRLRVDVADASGRIRAPGAAESRFTRSWTISPDEAPMEKARAMPFEATEWLQMRVDHTGHSLVARVASPGRGLPAAQSFGGERGDWRYSLLDEAGRVIAQGQFDDPRLVRGPMALPGESRPSHETAVLPAGHYWLPGVSPARKIRISPAAATTEKLDAGSLPAVTELLLASP